MVDVKFQPLGRYRVDRCLDGAKPRPRRRVVLIGKILNGGAHLGLRLDSAGEPEVAVPDAAPDGTPAPEAPMAAAPPSGPAHTPAAAAAPTATPRATAAPAQTAMTPVPTTGTRSVTPRRRWVNIRVGAVAGAAAATVGLGYADHLIGAPAPHRAATTQPAVSHSAVPAPAPAPVPRTTYPGRTITIPDRQARARQRGPARRTPAAPGPLPVNVALEQMHSVVDQGRDADQIRFDAALDFDHLFDHIQDDLEDDKPVDLGKRLGDIRVRVSQRLKEDAITQQRADQLNAIMSRVAT